MKNLWGRKVLAFVFFLTGVFFLGQGVLQAQEPPRLELKTMVEKEVKVKKKGQWITERITADKTGPGDILVYTITYLNVGKSPAVDAQIVNPVPRGAALLPESAGGKDADVTCSIDNGRNWQKPPIMIQMKKPDGSFENRAAPADRYNQIRWVIKKPVGPGQSGRVHFKVTVK